MQLSCLLLTTCFRRTSQKPDEELISKFKKTFPDVNSTGLLSGDGMHTGPAAVEGGMPDQYVFLRSEHSSQIMLIVFVLDPTKMISRLTIQLQETFKIYDSHRP
jgi:hypothetical protein